MPEIGTSGLMSGDGKRSVGHRPQATAPTPTLLGPLLPTPAVHKAVRYLSEVLRDAPVEGSAQPCLTPGNSPR
jgi:hypothetical protein